MRNFISTQLGYLANAYSHSMMYRVSGRGTYMTLEELKTKFKL